MNELSILLVVIPILMLVNILLGIALSDFNHNFNKEVAIRGLKKGLLIYVSIGLLVFVGLLMPEFKVTIGEVELTLYFAIVAILTTVAFKYGNSAIKNFMEVWQIKATDIAFKKGVE